MCKLMVEHMKKCFGEVRIAETHIRVLLLLLTVKKLKQQQNITRISAYVLGNYL